MIALLRFSKPHRIELDSAQNHNVMLYHPPFYDIALVMTTLSVNSWRLDHWAVSISGLCLVHCVATSIGLALLASAGAGLGSPWVHEAGLALAMVLGAVALGRGIIEHGLALPGAVGGLGLGVMAGALTLPHDGAEVLYTIVGVSILALGHRLNVLATD